MTRESVRAEMKTHSSHKLKKKKKESALQCKGHLLDPWFVKIPHAMEQLIPLTTTTQPTCYND